MITFDDTPITIEDITAIARGEIELTLSPDPAFAAGIRKGSAFLEQLL